VAKLEVAAASTAAAAGVAVDGGFAEGEANAAATWLLCCGEKKEFVCVSRDVARGVQGVASPLS
jgi:hypothetical protein